MPHTTVYLASSAGPQTLMLEFVGIAAFLLVSLLGIKTTLWWVVGALAVHGVFDWFHGRLIADPGVPSWWPMFCLTSWQRRISRGFWVVLRYRQGLIG